MKNFKYIILLILIINLVVSCNDFLDEEPSKSTATVPDKLEHLEALLNNYGEFYSEPAAELIFSTDDYGFITDLYDASTSSYSLTSLQYGTWDKEYLSNTNRPYWPREWEKIFTANLVMQNLGSVAGEDTEKKQIKAEAHFIRAYSYFQLANIYCLPYTEGNKQELGLPIKETTSFEESMERVSLEDTWKFIESDLNKALELTRSFTQVNDLNRTWRASTAAVNGFAARYYLALNNYEMAQSYAQKALNEYDFLRDYNTDMSFSDAPTQVTIFNPEPTQVSIDFPYTHDSQEADLMLAWGESYYFRALSNGSWKYWPSEELLSLYNQTYDLRFKYHMVEGYSYEQANAVDPPYNYPGYVFFHRSDILSGPSVPEMLLILAECQVRTGAYAQGIQTVNQLRASRMDASAPSEVINLSAVSQAEALVKVLEERRREMPFVHRWYDIRRYNNNEDSSDDVVVTRTFYPYNGSSILGAETPVNFSLEKNSRRYANPLPDTDIIASDNVLKQNTY